jgi:flavin reductase (DIM6/NTAB) family NADH-FMN oxidoreductase RutF
LPETAPDQGPRIFYRPQDGAPLAHDPFKAICAPRPIGWIGTCDALGIANLAPYSFFMPISSQPNMIAFSSEGLKHTACNARDRGEFTFSLATLDLATEMNISAAECPEGVDEFALAGLTKGISLVITTPFVAASPAAFECVTTTTVQLTDRSGSLIDRYLVIGEVVGVHLSQSALVSGRFDIVKARSIARAGYRDYVTVSQTWEMPRPDDED